MPQTICTSEYLGGCLDLTGEVGRVAVRLAGKRDVAGVKESLILIDAVKNTMAVLPNLGGGLGKKMGPLRGTQHKIENILYEMALVSSGKSKVAKIETEAEPKDKI